MRKKTDKSYSKRPWECIMCHKDFFKKKEIIRVKRTIGKGMMVICNECFEKKLSPEDQKELVNRGE